MSLKSLDPSGSESFSSSGTTGGGVVAQEVTLAIPDRVKKLVLMNIPVINNTRGNTEALEIMRSRNCISMWYQHFQQQPALPEAMITGNEETWIRYFFGKAGREGAISGDAIREYIRCYQIENTPATGAAYYRNIRHDVKRWAELAGTKFSVPGLYIHGSGDRVIIPAYLNHIEDCFGTIAVFSIEAGHFVQEEKPREVAALLNDFLVDKI
jgi:haloacetate dehalogenase